MKLLYIFIVLLFLFIVYLFVNKVENFKSENAYINTNGKFGDPLAIKIKRPFIQSITEQFPDVIVYENDYTNNRMGLDKCAEKCIPDGGQCVEFGMTGDAWCFPKVKFEPKNFKNDITKPNETKLSYPVT